MGEAYYPELSYKIVGVLYEVHKELGGQYQEKYYQRAVKLAFEKAKIDYIRELKVNLAYRDQNIGRYFLDFLIEKKIILELKAKPKISMEDYRQVKAYLVANKLKLGIIANFRGKKLVYKRVLNPTLI